MGSYLYRERRTLYQRILVKVTVAHVAALLALLVLPGLVGLFKPKPDLTDITMIDLSASLPGLPAGPLSVPKLPPKSEPEPAPEPEQESSKVPEPPKPQAAAPEPDEIPDKKAETKAKPKPQIKVSTNLVKRSSTTATPKEKTSKAASSLSAEQIRNLLAQGVPTSATGGAGLGGGGGSGAFSEMSVYFTLATEAFYRAWKQPDSATGSGLATLARITVRRDGTITAKSITRPSGNKLVDDSVNSALQAVSRLRPLPASFDGSTLDITITFKLERAL